jgi:hypothetical protein
VLGIFKTESQKLFARGWLQTMTLLISAPWVVRITGVSHWHLVSDYFQLSHLWLQPRSSPDKCRHRVCQTRI